MQRLCFLLLLSFDLSASVEFEIISRMHKDLSKKEILENYSLCNEYNRLYEVLSEKEQNRFEKINCKAIPQKEAELTSKKYFDGLEKEISIISEVNNEINVNESNIILKHYIFESNL